MGALDRGSSCRMSKCLFLLSLNIPCSRHVPSKMLLCRMSNLRNVSRHDVFFISIFLSLSSMCSITKRLCHTAALKGKEPQDG